MSDKPVTARLTVSLKPWNAPNFASRTDRAEESVYVADLDDAALDSLALAWLTDLYRKAGRRRCPFFLQTDAAPKDTPNDQ